MKIHLLSLMTKGSGAGGCMKRSPIHFETGLTCVNKNAIICVNKNAKRILLMRNNTYVKLERFYKTYRGYVDTRKLLEEGFSNRQITVLAEEGYLEKVSYGHYWLSRGQYTKPQDYKCIEVCLSNPRAVICMDSALYYQKVFTEEPEYLSIATERTDRSMMKMNFPTRRHYFSSSNFQIGRTKQATEFGCYYIYDIERSICDMRRLEPQITLEFIDCVKNNEQQYKRLLKYADLFRIKQF